MTLEEFADRLAIIELASTYENAFDDGDLDKNLATWAADMSFESPFGSFTDKDSYLTWMRDFKAQTVAAGGTRHLMTNHEIVVAGDTATMTSYLTILNQREKSIINTAVFRDRLAKSDGEWKFVRRQVSVDGY